MIEEEYDRRRVALLEEERSGEQKSKWKRVNKSDTPLKGGEFLGG